MIDEFFAINALNDYFEKVKINGEHLKLTDQECEAVVSTITKGKSKYLHLLLDKTDESLERSVQIKSLLLGRIAIKDLILDNFSKEEALKHLETMPSLYAKNILKSLK